MSDGTPGEGEEQKTGTVVKSPPLKDWLSCECLKIDESCIFSDEGCEAWQNWNTDNKYDKKAEYFCKLPAKERDKYN